MGRAGPRKPKPVRTSARAIKMRRKEARQQELRRVYDNPLCEHPPPTYKGISKQDLMFNRKGRLVLKSRHFVGKQLYAAYGLDWVEAVRDVRRHADPLCSAVPEGKGYEYAKQVLGIRKDIANYLEDTSRIPEPQGDSDSD